MSEKWQNASAVTPKKTNKAVLTIDMAAQDVLPALIANKT